MVIWMLNKKQIEDYLDTALEEEHLEDILERFDVTPLEAFVTIFEAGLIDPLRLEEL